MRAVYLTRLRQMEVRDVPSPRLAETADVLLQVDRVGVCGSDIHYFTHGRIGPNAAPFPLILGHELGATVLEAGPAVTNLLPGQRVAIDPLIACGRCDQCQAGRKHTCRNQKFLGSLGQPGAMTERLIMPGACCKPVPDSLSDDEVAIAEPLSIAVYAVQIAGLASQARVGIVGSGPIGLCTLLAIRAMTDAAAVYVTDLVDERLALAHRCGATWTGNPRHKDVVASVHRLEPLGLDAVFECAGEQDALDQGVQLLKPGGALLVVGIPAVDRVSFDINLLRRNELRILNVRRQNLCTERAVELIASKQVDVRPLVTHHFPLEESARAFEMVSGRRDGVVKAIIRVSAEK